MDMDGISSIRELIAEAVPDVILGADIVGFSFCSYFHELRIDHPEPGLRSVCHSTPHCHNPLGDFNDGVDGAASCFRRVGSHCEETRDISLFSRCCW